MPFAVSSADDLGSARLRHLHETQNLIMSNVMKWQHAGGVELLPSIMGTVYRSSKGSSEESAQHHW